MFRRWFVEHPQSVGESYFEHQRMAFGFGFRLIAGGLACTIHGLFPALFTRTGSDTVRELHRRMIEQRGSAPRLASDSIQHETV